MKATRPMPVQTVWLAGGETSAPISLTAHPPRPFSTTRLRSGGRLATVPALIASRRKRSLIICSSTYGLPQLRGRCSTKRTRPNV